MYISIIPTCRYNAKCKICHIWRCPTIQNEEVALDTLKKLPNGIDNLNFGGGEPTIRKDLEEAADILYPKAKYSSLLRSD